MVMKLRVRLIKQLSRARRSKYLRAISDHLFPLAARLLSLLFPEKLWYRVVLRVCRLQGPILQRLIKYSPYRHDSRKHIVTAWLLNSWLTSLVQLRRAFPIPIRIVGRDVLMQAARNPGGVLYCSSHIPLANICARPLIDLNLAPSAVVAGKRVTWDGEFPAWGLVRGLPVLSPGSSLLVRTRTILRRGGSVALLIDRHLDEPYSPNVFRLARTLGTQVVFMVAALQQDGYIEIEYFLPPDPFCKTDEGIYANLRVLEHKVQGILRGGVAGTRTGAKPSAEASPRAGKLAGVDAPTDLTASEAETAKTVHD